MHPTVAWLARALLRCFPEQFRVEVGADLLDTIERRVRDRLASQGTLAASRQGLKELAGLAAGGLRMRWVRWSTRAFQAPATSSKAVVSAFRQDVTLALRTFGRNAGFTTIVILTFAIGIGGTTAVFSVVDGAFVRPLPYQEAGDLVTVWNRAEDTRDDREWVLDIQIQDLRRRANTLADVAAVKMVSGRILGGSRPIHTDVARVSANLFDILGVEPFIGRLFAAGDDSWRAPWVVVLSHDYWSRELGGDPEIVGKQIKVGWPLMEVIGVLPPSFDFRPHESVGTRVRPDLWIPHQVNVRQLTASSPGAGVSVLARLSPDATVAAAREELAGMDLDLWSLRAELTREVRPMLVLLVISVGFVLLVVVANISTLVLARTDARVGELALRRSLGASRARVARQLITENLLLAAVGGAFGVLFAGVGVQALMQFAPLDLPLESSIGIDPWVLAFAVFSTMLAGVSAGVVPAMRSRRTVPLGTFFGRSRRGEAGARGVHGGFVVAQVALSLVLLGGAGLTTRSLIHLINVDPGFEPAQALTFSVYLMDEYPTPERHAGFYAELNIRLRQDPGVIAVGGTSALPLAPPHSAPVFAARPGVLLSSYLLPGAGFEPAEGFDPGVEWWIADHVGVTDGYFAAAGVKVIGGRGFRGADRSDSPLVVVVDRTMAELVWPEADPIGQRLWATNAWRTVVGVTSATNHRGLGRPGPPQIYYPVSQVVIGRMSMIVRSRSPFSKMASRARQVVAGIDPLVPIGDVRPLRWMRDRELAPARFVSLLLLVFAAAGGAVASVGLFAVVSYTAGRRRREAAIRRTLGSPAVDAGRAVIAYGMRLTAIGVGLGLIAALALSRPLAPVLHGGSSSDTGVLIGAAAVSLGIGFLACWIPARRATLRDPLAILSSD